MINNTESDIAAPEEYWSLVRTRRPFYRSRPGRWLWISTVLVAVLTIAFPYLPFAGIFGFIPLPPALMSFIIAITLAYLIAAEAVKQIFYKRLIGC